MAAVETVYTHIARNNIKTVFLILLFPVSLCILVGLACLAAVHVINDPEFSMSGALLLQGWFPSIEITDGNLTFYGAMGFMIYAVVPIFIMAIIWMLISMFFGDRMMLAFAEARPLQKKDNAKVYRSVENVAIAAGLPTPEIYIIDDESLNAFATGYSPRHASIALTSGIIAKLEPLELEAVIAHEMAHIGNRDIRLNVMIITGLGIFGFLADFLRIGMRSGNGGNSKKNGQAQLLIFFIIMALVVFNFIVAPIIHMAISRTREYGADATGALITRNPAAMASALKKISEDARVEILDEQPRMSMACIANPKEDAKDPYNPHKVSLSALETTHPPISSRIARLQKMIRG